MIALVKSATLLRLASVAALIGMAPMAVSTAQAQFRECTAEDASNQRDCTNACDAEYEDDYYRCELGGPANMFYCVPFAQERQGQCYSRCQQNCGN